MSGYMDRRARRGVDRPPFRPNMACPKCGHDEIRTVHREAGCSDPKCHSCDQEHLCRCCQRCHFDWPEQVMA